MIRAIFLAVCQKGYYFVEREPMRNKHLCRARESILQEGFVIKAYHRLSFLPNHVCVQSSVTVVKSSCILCQNPLMSIVECDENFSVETMPTFLSTAWDDDIVYDVVILPDLQKA